MRPDVDMYAGKKASLTTIAFFQTIAFFFVPLAIDGQSSVALARGADVQIGTNPSVAGETGKQD